MATYQHKVIQGLKPNWYMELSKKKRLEAQKDIQLHHKEGMLDKPDCVQGVVLIAKENTNSLTKGSKYKVRGHFCTHITTIFATNWRQFVTVKNDFGYTVKVNLNNFIAPATCTTS